MLQDVIFCLFYIFSLNTVSQKLDSFHRYQLKMNFFFSENEKRALEMAALYGGYETQFLWKSVEKIFLFSVTQSIVEKIN